MGTSGPPSFSTFLLRRELKEQLGMTLEDFRALPWREAEEYMFYMQMIRREEENRRRQNGSH